LSYVFERREQALSELLRVTKPGGRLFLGVMSLWGAIHHFLPGVLDVPLDVNREIIVSGDLSRDRPEVSTHFCHMYRASELRSLLEGAGVVIEVLSASDCLSATWDELLEPIEKDDTSWRHLLEMEIEACREPGCIDMGTHLIAVCRILDDRG
jgi:hypothetical protein